ncbi:MAG: hypothetical protein K2X87_27735 [Gemmataceae bacterium]|nr:hypothetical protein [Gemmataceae bacterium]
MSLSLDEALFLRRWVYDEARYRDGVGPDKRLQVERGVSPADLAALVAAAFPDPADQEATTVAPAGEPTWPWGDDTFLTRLSEARGVLADRD